VYAGLPCSQYANHEKANPRPYPWKLTSGFQAPEPCEDAQIDVYPDLTQLTNEIEYIVPYDSTLAGRSETAVDHDSEIFEYFDINNAALDHDNLRPSQMKRSMDNTTPSATLYSPAVHSFTPDFPRSPHNPVVAPTEPGALQSHMQACSDLVSQVISDVSMELTRVDEH
jgi:hypothetical protein